MCIELLKIIEKNYRPPREVKEDDSANTQDIDEIKMHELKEVSLIFLS